MLALYDIDWNAWTAVSTTAAVVVALGAIIRTEQIQAARENKRIIEQRILQTFELSHLEPALSLQFYVDTQMSIAAHTTIDQETWTSLIFASRDRWTESNRKVDAGLSMAAAFLRGAAEVGGPYALYSQQFRDLSALILALQIHIQSLRVYILSPDGHSAGATQAISDHPLAEAVRSSANAVTTQCIRILSTLYRPTVGLSEEPDA